MKKYSINKLVNLTNIFYKLAGDSVTDDLANHIYVNTILQNLPKEDWPEVYLNYAIEGADKVIKYAIKVFLNRFSRDYHLEEYDDSFKNNIEKFNAIASKLSNNYDVQDLEELKNLFNIIPQYSTSFRKNWIVSINQLISLVKAKKDLEQAIANKEDSISIYNKKVKLNIELNTFYSTAHTHGSMLHHLLKEEDRESSKFKSFEDEDKNLEKILRLQDMSRSQSVSPATLLHEVKKFISTPGRYESHKEHTKFKSDPLELEKLEDETKIIAFKRMFKSKLNNFKYHLLGSHDLKLERSSLEALKDKYLEFVDQLFDFYKKENFNSEYFKSLCDEKFNEIIAYYHNMRSLIDEMNPYIKILTNIDYGMAPKMSDVENKELENKVSNLIDEIELSFKNFNLI